MRTYFLSCRYCIHIALTLMHVFSKSFILRQEHSKRSTAF
jgi:hypothetical protein